MPIPWLKQGTTFTIDYFIKIYNDLSDEDITLSTVPSPCDAWEWLFDARETEALYNIIHQYGILLAVNDGMGYYKDLGKTPRARVLAFLQFIKKREDEKAY